MKVLVIGGNGSIGKRYCAILRYLKVNYEIYEINDVLANSAPPEADRWLIASPTSTHFEYCMEAIKRRKPFLCEKPLSKSLDQCREIRDAAQAADVDGRVVCNYKIAFEINFGGTVFEGALPYKYEYFNTGKDGVFWDLCQLIYMNPNLLIDTDSPTWCLWMHQPKQPSRTFVDAEKPQPSIFILECLEQSYRQMIQAWFRDNPKWPNLGIESLWSLDDGVNMTKAVIERMEREKVKIL